MIEKFQKFNLSLHEHNNIDPWGEEDWNEPEFLDDKDLIDITLKTPLEVGNRIYDFQNEYYGVIVEVINDGEFIINKEFRHQVGIIQWLSKMALNIFGYKVKVEKQFENNDVDPFDEEDWNEPEILDDKDLTEISMRTDLKIGDKIYTYDNIYDGVITEDFKDGNYMVRRIDRVHFLSKVQFYIFGYKLMIKE